MQNWIVSLLALAVVGIGTYTFTRPTPASPPLGAASPSFFERLELFSGKIESNLVATSSQSATITVAAADLRQWVTASQVSYTPGLNLLTLTLPASTTLTSLVPKAGDKQDFCFRNATSTSGTEITFAGGTGSLLNVASSSVSAVGSKVVRTGQLACFTVMRQPSTATTFDIDFLMTVFE